MTDTFRIGKANLKELYVYHNGFTTGQIPTATAEVNRFVFAHDSEATTIQNDPRFSRRFATGAASTSADTGSMKSNPLPSAPRSNRCPLEYSTPQPAVGAPYIDGVRVQEQIGIYAQDQIRFGDGWIATLNGRCDKVSSSFDNRIDANLDREDDAFSWRLALMRQISDVTPYVTAGTYPQALDASTLTSQPETGQQIEVDL